MLQLAALHSFLPTGYTVDQDDERLLVRCGWCGWELIRWCGRYSPNEVIETAYHHHASCSKRPPYAR